MGKRKTVTLLVAVGLLAGALSSLVSVTAQTRGATYIVRMREQADLNAVRGNRVAVETLLRATAERTQAPLLARLEAWRQAGKVQSYQSLWIINAITVRAPDGEVLDALRADPTVARVTVSAPVSAPPTRVTRAAPISRLGGATKADGLVKIGADQLWNRATNPTTGAGVRVAIIDTGLDATGEQFTGKSITWKDFIGTSLTPYDDATDGHGTHVAGTIAGTNQSAVAVVGVAPGASLIIAKALDLNKGGTADVVLAAAQWALNPDNNLNTADGADIVNSSLGTNVHDDDATDPDLQQMVSTLRAANVLPVFAIGNWGPGNKTTASPGDYVDALGVGATDNSDVVAAFSSRGPVVWGGTTYTKPDLTAPGVSILSAGPTSVFPSGYGLLSGTSQAAPHVAGAAALAISAARMHKGFTPTVDSLIAKLKSTAVDLGIPGADSDYGSGRINAVALVDAFMDTPAVISKPTLVEPTEGAIFRQAVTQVKASTTVTGGALLKYKISITKTGGATTVYDQTTETGAAAFDQHARAYTGGQTATVTVAALSTGVYTWTAAVTSDNGTSWTTSDAGTFAVNQAPGATAVSPDAGALVETATPTFQVTLSDADGDRLKGRIVVSQNGTPVATFDQVADATGWDKADYASGETATFTVPAGQALSNGAYTWTAAANDGTEWGADTAARALTIGVNTVPGVPEQVAPADGAYTTATPTFQVRATDADGNTLRYKIVVTGGGATATFDQTADAAGWDKASYASGETATFTVPASRALAEGGTFQWKALAYDGKAWSAESAARSVTVDRTPTAPELLAPAASALTTGIVTFQVRATDADSQVRFKLVLTSGATSVTYDQTVDAAGWQGADAGGKYNSGQTATFTVPAASPLAAGSYTWQAYANDGMVWSAASATGSFTVNADAPAVLPAALGTFALGFDLGQSVTRASLGLGAVPMKVYNPAIGDYEDAPNDLVPGRGYWLKPGTPVSLSAAGPGRADATFTIALQKGWNFISSPFARPLTWSLNAIQVESGGVTRSLAQATDVIEDYAWGYVANTGLYQLVYDATVISGIPASQLAPWRGYWVKVKADGGCNLILPNPDSVSGASVARASASGWSVPVQVRAAAGTRTVVLGVTDGRALAVGQPPQPPGADAGLSAVLVQNGAPLAVDVRSGGRGRVEWEMVVTAGASDADVVIAPDLRALPKDLSLTLIDTATGAQRSLRTSAGYRFRPTGEARSFRVVAQPRGSVTAAITDIRVLKTRGGRTVQFTLSRAAVADVEIVSPTGKVVATLARSRASQAGVNFAGANDSLARGLYLVRVRATTEDGATVQAVRLVTVTD